MPSPATTAIRATLTFPLLWSPLIGSQVSPAVPIYGNSVPSPGIQNSPRTAANGHGGCCDEYAWIGPAGIHSRAVRAADSSPEDEPTGGQHDKDNASDAD
ncbi:hypothetical protein Adu01nite_03740 [Paractinoplanes durhamensis]|uniref:Secreted protein n=1 Tax=Paractinoplanes durhamensis TaxID=113563 RepID=A0ABQ3YNR1_9ACTN|nr:hypothetical protein Adu01nite_03740 [Actinoplanes durhamensis]